MVILEVPGPGRAVASVDTIGVNWSPWTELLCKMRATAVEATTVGSAQRCSEPGAAHMTKVAMSRSPVLR
jgi:hypothetical protein